MSSLHGIQCSQAIVLTETWTRTPAACTKQQTRANRWVQDQAHLICYSWSRNTLFMTERGVSSRAQNVEETPISLETPQTLSQMFQLARMQWKYLCRELKHSRRTDQPSGKDTHLWINRKAPAMEYIYTPRHFGVYGFLMHSERWTSTARLTLYFGCWCGIFLALSTKLYCYFFSWLTTPLLLCINSNRCYSGLQNGSRKHVNWLMTHVTHLWTFTPLLAVTTVKMSENSAMCESRYEIERATMLEALLSSCSQYEMETLSPIFNTFPLVALPVSSRMIKLEAPTAVDTQVATQQVAEADTPICRDPSATYSGRQLFSHLLLPLQAMFRGWSLMQMWLPSGKRGNLFLGVAMYVCMYVYYVYILYICL